MTTATAIIGPQQQSITVELPTGWERVELPRIPLAAREAQPPPGAFASNLTVRRLGRPGVEETTLITELAEVIAAREGGVIAGSVRQSIDGRNWQQVDMSYIDPAAGTLGQRHLFLEDIQLVISFAGSRVSELRDQLGSIVASIRLDPGQPEGR